ncbi:MAG: DUF1501 domain-containing protein [Planctomycetaceae bacterium]
MPGFDDSTICAEFGRLRRMPRRTVVEAGALGLLGLSLPKLWGSAASAAEDDRGLGRAKRCIFLFMWGGPSQLDTFDMKPEAPAEVRGPFQSIATPVPGLQVCEHFKHLAPLMDRVAVVRSLTHDDPAHLSSVHTVLTGHLPPVNKSDGEPPSERDTPCVGSVISKVRAPQNGLPASVTMPWLVYHPSAPGGVAPGQHGGWLGRAFDPLLVGGDPGKPDWSVPALSLLDGLSSPRLLERQHLLTDIEAQRRGLERAAAAARLSVQQERAFGLLASPAVRTAFDLHAEPDDVRDRYGRNTHGQCVLLARRLIERGVQLVSVNWHNDGRNFWDTHGNNFTRLQNDLIPPADRALAALLTDLEDRGLLDETLVVWVGEFGRKPQINASQAGREHHPFCYSGLLAGGGVQGGSIYGRSDATASYPAEGPVSPQDFNATIMHALGIGAETTLPDRTGRPALLRGGHAIADLFA